MQTSYTTVKEYAEYRYEDRKSVFIGHCMPVKNEAEAIDFVSKIKKIYPDARHHVYGYVLKDNAVTRFTDDREPQGTAGLPVLDVIRKSGCVNTIIVVVRYFGGTLLGTGGLVKAYTEAAVGALKASKIITYNVYTTISIITSYSDYQKISSLFEKFDFLPIDTEYAENVKITGTILSSCVDEFVEKLIENTSGRCKTEKISESYDYRNS